MAQAKAQRVVYRDPVTLDPSHYKVEFENERIRVLRVNYGPRERSVMHGHPDVVLVFLTDAQCRFTYPDGTTRESEERAGQIFYVPAEEHVPENLGDRPILAIMVELKG